MLQKLPIVLGCNSSNLPILLTGKPVVSLLIYMTTWSGFNLLEEGEASPKKYCSSVILPLRLRQNNLKYPYKYRPDPTYPPRQHFIQLPPPPNLKIVDRSLPVALQERIVSPVLSFHRSFTLELDFKVFTAKTPKTIDRVF